MDADGNWSTASNWDPRVPNIAGERAIFGGVITAPRTVTVDRPVTVGHIVFDNTNAYVIAAADSATDSITLDVKSGDAMIQVTTGSHSISAPLNLADDTVITVLDPAGKLTIIQPLGNAGVSLTKAGAGTLEVPSIRAITISERRNACSARVIRSYGWRNIGSRRTNHHRQSEAHRWERWM